MTTTEAPTGEQPFSRIKVRVTGLVFCGTEVALLRRTREDKGTVHYTTIGGILCRLSSPQSPLPAFELEPITDANYTWI
ncbi:hypothetical protein P3T36_004887 [Kitasatospora sp. MAP12-15]|uniref:hypothetical protein n=1 Tax=unclassified Kitasatospora TaxID=2633591 RepID=UPI002473BFA7|nr:hypothetical protein [Kitasatospora sp. MAP12-44]MDH6110181.1 hypothetical protein [Kitasatospora sp. MAP12-44]